MTEPVTTRHHFAGRPLPWDTGREGGAVRDAAGRTIGLCLGIGEPDKLRPGQERKAVNALWAAAPELLAAVDKAIRWFEQETDKHGGPAWLDDFPDDVLRAAIAKAKEAPCSTTG